MKILMCFLFLLPYSSFAINDADVDKMVKEFERSGIIPPGEADRVRAEIGKISPQQWKEIEGMAQEYQKQMNSPDVQNNLGSAVHNVNTDSDQFRNISSDLKKIMQERKDLID